MPAWDALAIKELMNAEHDRSINMESSNPMLGSLMNECRIPCSLLICPYSLLKAASSQLIVSYSVSKSSPSHVLLSLNPVLQIVHRLKLVYAIQ